MPYDMRNPEHGHDMHEILNKVCTHLAEGEKWHGKVSNELRKMPNKRGYARIHDDEACGDGEKLICLSKMMRDHLGHAPVIDMQEVAKAEGYTVDSFEGFKNHFKVWSKREKEYADTLNMAIDSVRDKDIDLYHKFCEMAKDVKIEAMRAEWIHDSLADCEWGKHHCAVVSKWLHEQAEAAPRSWNWNIG